MVKKYLLIFVLLAAIFSCKSPAARNIEAEPDVYTQSYVDKHFPNWDVGIVAFVVENDTVSISLAEKTFVVEGLAILRVLVNTPEFDESAINLAWATNGTMYSYSTEKAQPAGGQWNITDKMQKLDKYRVLHTVKRIGYDLWVQKKASKQYVQNGSHDHMVYSYMDLTNDYKIGRKIWLHNKDWTQWPTGRAEFLNVFFHESLHNLGYQHDGRPTGDKRFDNVPYVYGQQMRELYNAIHNKYATQIEKMKVFYLNKYRSVINSEPLPNGGWPGDYRVGVPRRTH